MAHPKEAKHLSDKQVENIFLMCQVGPSDKPYQGVITDDEVKALCNAHAAYNTVKAERDVDIDKAYLNGMRAGWNLGVAGDNAKFDRITAARQEKITQAQTIRGEG